MLLGLHFVIHNLVGNVDELDHNLLSVAVWQLDRVYFDLNYSCSELLVTRLYLEDPFMYLVLVLSK